MMCVKSLIMVKEREREREEADNFKAMEEQEIDPGLSFCIVPNHMVVSIHGS